MDAKANGRVNPFLVVLDRDGTLNKDFGGEGLGYRDSNWRKKLELFKDVPKGLRLMAKVPKTYFAVVTNQSGIARGGLTLETVKDINREIETMLLREAVVIHSWQIAPFVSKDYAIKYHIPRKNPWVKKNDLRKPETGMLRNAAHEIGLDFGSLVENNRIYVIGDRVTDVETGLNANGYGIFVRNGGNSLEMREAHTLSRRFPGKAFVAESFYQASDFVYSHMTVRRLRGE